MCALKKVDVSAEREIEDYIVKNPSQLESELKILGHQIETDRGPLDILALDQDKTVVVIEIKKEEGTIDMLTQALEYYDWAFENRSALATFYPKAGINIHKAPRIVLVAEDFSQQLITVAKHVRPAIELKTYACLEFKEGESGFFFSPREIPIPKGPPSPPPSVEEQISYITNANVQKACREVLQKLVDLGEGIELKATEYYLACQFKNRNFAVIQARRDYFYVWTADWINNLRIERSEDFTSEWFEKFKQDFVKIGGKLKV